MLKILMLKSKKAYLPEANIYKEFFWDFAKITYYSYNEEINVCDYDIIWRFMGIDFFQDKIAKDLKKAALQNKKIPFLIHEYPSVSTGKFARIKNYLKKKLNSKPNLRIFLNAKVMKEFGFDDNIDFIYRDMGILKAFFEQKEAKKEYDFVYVGEINFDRKIDKLLEKFTKENMKKYTILLIGTPHVKIYEKFKKNKNIIFMGFVNYHLIPALAAKAKYGINWRPNKYPHNFQTSTKLLEYCALNLKIINLQNDFSDEFAEKFGIKFYNVKNINENFDIKKIKKFDYVSTFENMQDFEWLNYLIKIDFKKKLIEALEKNNFLDAVKI